MGEQQGLSATFPGGKGCTGPARFLWLLCGKFIEKGAGVFMTGYEHLCVNCMNDTEGKEQCPHCGFSESEPQQKDALPYRTVLQERYMIGRVKFCNSEGFTYIAFDMQQLCTVQIREFFPREICARITNSTDLAVIAGNEAAFDEYLDEFVTYQESIAKLSGQKAIIPVQDIFEENYTAYAVSPWEESITLRYFVQRSGGSLSWNAAWKLFMPIIGAVSSMYASGIGHYGISPDTLYIMQDGSMKLGSFCSATVRMAQGGLQADLVPGCAAIEQYDPQGALGEYTDVYGMASTLFFVLTGVLPNDALKRRSDPRLLLPASTLRAIPPHVITALANALQIGRAERTSTFERFRAELSATPTPTASLEETQNLRRIPSPYDDSVDQKVRTQEAKPDESGKGIPKFVWIVLACVAALVVVTVLVVTYMSAHAGQPTSSSLISAVSQNASAAAAGKTKTGSGVGSGLSTASAAAVSGNGASSSTAGSAAQSGAASQQASDSTQIDVPNLIGQRFSSLQSNSNYQVVQTSKEFNDSIQQGCIISQTPASGKMVKGAAVSVTVSLGKALRTLPDVSGKSYDTAKSEVEAAGFVPDGKTEQSSDTVPQGSVIGYGSGLTAGSQLNYQFSVTLIVSSGPASGGSTDNTDTTADGGTGG